MLGVPLAVIPRATGPYDDAKAWALPMLVALTGLAWLARRQVHVLPPPDRRARGLRFIVLACVAWWAVTTVVSMAPFQSVLGAFGRGTGLLVVGSAALVFFLVQAEMRSVADVRSLVDVALLGSVPVCALALAQAAGWDPLPKPWDPATVPLTVRSTLGSHIFLGAYLVLLIPLAAARLEWACRQRGAAGRWPAASRAQWRSVIICGAWAAGAVLLIGLAASWSALWWAVVPWGIVGALAWTRHGHRLSAADTAVTVSLWTGLLTAQVVVVVLSRGRGAFIGMVVGLSVTGFALLIRHRAWKTVATAAAGVAGLIVFLVLLNVPGSPVAPLGKLPLLTRLSDIADVQPGSPGWVRLQVWRGISEGWRRQFRGEELLPGVSPTLRGFIGYGPETQLLVFDVLVTPFLGTLVARGDGWQARYVFDRAHNVLLDHLVTEGLIGVGLWSLAVGTLIVVGVTRIRTSVIPGESTIRLGALGALVGHLAEGQVGIATPTVLALFWLFAALLTTAPWIVRPPASTVIALHSRFSRAVWMTMLVSAVLLTLLVGWLNTRWLLASVAYADGVRHGIAGQLLDAYRDFRRAVALMPRLSLPAESAAYTALRLATGESDPSRRIGLLREADTVLASARPHFLGGSGFWALTAQVALARARGGDRSQLVVSRDAFATALRLRPGDPSLLAQSAWVWLESGDAPRARQIAEQVLARHPLEWVAWAVLARASGSLGDMATAESSTARARVLAPPEAQRVLDALLP